MLQVLICLFLAVETSYTALKVDVNKVETNKQVNDPASFSNSNTKVDGLGDGKLKTFPENLKILSE